ncbi:MAG TPA: cyanophycin synthetase [Solirubrobacteraceae bacterium]
MSQQWSPEHAERHLRSLELFGMRFGLDRMHRMMTVLGSPERSFDSIHVVGTNGKTSTTRMIAAILERHGLRTGCYLSPHLVSYSERVQIAEHDVETHAFAAAIARAAWAAERVNRTLAEDDHVTQFELLTAAAFWELARRGAQVVVIEAGLGGRYDATNVIDSRVAVLTNVGLEHTRWLGPTLTDIATEKLAVLGEDSVLALGTHLQPEVLDIARTLAAERRAELLIAEEAPADLEVGVRGSFQRANFALARLAAKSYLERAGLRLSDDAVRAAAVSIAVPGRMQVVARDPLTVVDGAHNPAAVAALVESLPELLGGRSLALVLGVLEDKDAASMLAALLPLCERAWFTAPPSQRALSPATLASLARQLGFESASCESQPAKALAAAQSWARTQEGGAAVLATGSVYLVGDLFARARELGLNARLTPTDGHVERSHSAQGGGSA